MFLPSWKQKYFCKGDWTHESTNRPTGKSPDSRESKDGFLSHHAGAIGFQLTVDLKTRTAGFRPPLYLDGCPGQAPGMTI
jgi:hypothetical protein